MKAVVVTRHGGPEVLDYQDWPDPVPAEGQVLIKTELASVNYADVQLRRGTYHAGSPPPTIPGLDVYGTIVALGPEVSGLATGQKVAAFAAGGSYAELAVAPAILTFPVPAKVDPETAAAFPTVGITAYNLLTLAGRLVPGETVLVHAAAGGVGSVAVQLAKILGAGRVIGTVGSDKKAALAQELGCDDVINYAAEDFAVRVNEITGGAGADLILDSVAGPVFDRELSCLATFGRIVMYGHTSGEAGHVSTRDLHGPTRAVIGYSSSTYRRFRPQALRPAAEKVLGYLAAGRLRMVIGARFDLRDAPEAHRLIENREHVGKILLKVHTGG